ncbi:GNAT family N-acetyltransferase [Streptomyces termitum]|uniref:N-acetyltransferase n=1 Tax=Streptomyces termitum TaxID=67368 RepID=A0A918TD15_9ACTN|nr:GNAT family N-acetyltransferase [Streptomyces termitum]GHB09860.1 N-acetyltransferase [Streptomyces termitum]
MTDGLVVRPLTGSEELDLFLGLSYTLDHELSDDLASGRRLPEWMWVAVRDGRPLGRIAWWTHTAGAAPYLLDFFDLAPELSAEEAAGVGRRLLAEASAAVVPAGTVPPEYSRFLSPDWREDAVERAGVEARLDLLAETGARPLVERLRLEWRPGRPVAEPSGRLRFRPVRDREDLVALMARTLEGTLDAHSRAELAGGLAAREAAERQYDGEFARYASPRDWWRIAERADTGDPVGFVVPARNSYNPIIAYIGVLPDHRGHGYIDEILAEGTRILAGTGVDRVRASTDVGNVPMAAAFARAGYAVFQRQIDCVWDAPGASPS